MTSVQAKVMQVIEVRALLGRGIKGDPVREVVGYFSLDGEPLAEKDAWVSSIERDDTTETSPA